MLPDDKQVGFTHPRTSCLEDPDLPVVATLFGSLSPPPVQAAVAATGGRVTDSELAQVMWWPGYSITVRYRVTVSGGSLDGGHTFICVAGRIPDGAMIVEGEPGPVGVWRVPHDPALPGLGSALDQGQAARLLENLGAEEGPVTTRLRSYRPGRRAVVAVSGSKEGLYIKLVRPSRVEALHDSHRWLASAVPVPKSLGFAPDQGLIALQSLPGKTLRVALEDRGHLLPSAEEIVVLSRSLPAPQSDRMSASPIERVTEIVVLLKAVAPELSDRIDRLAEGIGGEQSPATTATHGDYYESQLLVDRGRLVGLLDVDTYGWGRPADDAATMLGHLAIWAGLSTSPTRVRDLGGRLLRIWDGIVDPVDLRLRTAAVVLSLATGPFRVQSATWPGETADRVGVAERWLESARLADEKNLTLFSG
jgi:aminoglycoside phosphotransferase